jgi:MFS superfamily sulfate permease-like transporter
MQILLKISLSIAIILLATAIAKKFPSAAGLIAVMPLTGALVLVWVYVENKGNPEVMQGFAKGALWGMLPQHPFLSHCIALLQETHTVAWRSGREFRDLAPCSDRPPLALKIKPKNVNLGY